MRRHTLFAALCLALLCLTVGCGSSAPKNSGEGSAAAVQETQQEELWFSYAGGSGRVKLALREVREINGRTEAEIVFSSSHYTKAVVGGETFLPESGAEDGSGAQSGPAGSAGTTSFWIPAVPGQETDVTATTTAMSEPHDIDYRIFIGTREEAERFSDHVSREGDLSALGEQISATPSGASSSSSGEETPLTPPEIPGLTYEGEMPLEYAEQFAVFRYQGGCSVLAIRNSGEYLVVPEGEETPENLPEGLEVLHQPLQHIYNAATASMSFFSVLGAMDRVAFASMKRDSWKIDAPKEAYDAGTLLYGGKYSAPDYELLLKNGCDLALESSMIFYAPKVREKLQDLGIPVLVDRESYEPDVFGRVEWIKMYGVLLGREDEAQAFFEEQKEILTRLSGQADTGRSAAFFAVRPNGAVSARASADLVPDMMKKAGGHYVFDDLRGDGSTHTAELTMEQFYAGAKDADFLVYNAAIEAPLQSTADLLKLNPLFGDFKAVRGGQVYEVDDSWLQSSASLGSMLWDFHLMFAGGDPEEFTFLKKLE